MLSKTEVVREAISKLAEGDAGKEAVLAEVFDVDRIERDEVDMWTPELPPFRVVPPDPLEVAEAQVARCVARLESPPPGVSVAELERLLQVAVRDRDCLRKGSHVGS